MEQLDVLAKRRGAMAAKLFLADVYPGGAPDKHELAHRLGEIVIRERSFDGFGLCDELLDFGCFHGAALAAVRLEGSNPKLGAMLWAGCQKTAKYPGDCLHGLGHAIMVINGYDLERAYGACDELLNSKYAFWCEDGVSMENISRSMANVSAGGYGKYDDDAYPCNAVEKKYEKVCVKNHIAFLKRARNYDLAQLLLFCSEFSSSDTAGECMGMIGNLYVRDNFSKPELVIHVCADAETYVGKCIAGGALALSMSARFEEAGRLCQSIVDGPDNEACFRTIEYFKNR